MIRTLVVPLLVGIALAPSASSAPPAERLAESVEVRRARVPVVFDPRRGGRCDAPDPDWVTLTEDGTPARVVGLEPPGGDAAGAAVTSPTLHALVLDTSASMRRRLEELRDATRRYVDALGPGDAVLVAILNDRLVLLQEPTLDHDAARNAIDRLELGYGTALWLALDDLFAYLDSYPGRKIAALLTDGCDMLYPEGPSPGSVIEAAERSSELTVFPVLVDAPSRCPSRQPLDPRMRMRRLALRTGGELFEVGDQRSIRDGLDRVAPRLAREGWLVFVPPEHSEPLPRRELDLRAVRDAPCDVRLAASAIRVERDARTAGEASPPRLVDGGTRWVGTFPAQDGGRLAVWGPVPPIEDLPSPGSYAAMIVSLAEYPPEDGGDRTPPPFVVPGGALLRGRTEFARGLYAHPDYRAWARSRIAERRRQLVPVARGREDDPAVAGYRAWIASDAWDPEPGELRAVLGAWLGDVAVADLAATVDVTLARQRLLDPAAAVAGEVGWRRFRAWMEPVGDSAEIGLVLPSYGEAGDRIGFRRVVLPIRGSADERAAQVPEAPIAARLAAFLGIDAADVRAARYHAVSRREARSLARAERAAGNRVPVDRGGLRAVRLWVGAGDDWVVAWFRTRGPKGERTVEAEPLAWTAPEGSPLRRERGGLREIGGPVLLPPPKLPGADGGEDDR